MSSYLSYEDKIQDSAIRSALLRSERLVRGNFDKQHLLDIHAFIFDPFLGEEDFRPGEFREELPKGIVRSKNRGDYQVDYSRMDKEAKNRLDAVLEDIKPDKLRVLDKDTLAKKFSDYYAELDYIHPFCDGNSRTLREFFSQCAEELGYTLKLDRGLKFEREHLYKARDRAVLEKAYIEEGSEDYKNKIAGILSNQLDRAGSLEIFFKRSIQPMDLYEKANFKGNLKERIEDEPNNNIRDLLKDKLVFFEKCIKDKERGR